MDSTTGLLRDYLSPMRGLILLLVAATTVVAFRAGARWRRNTLTWGDHRVARGKERGLRKLRWTTLRLAIGGMFLLIVYLVASGAIGIAVTTNDKPTKQSPQPTCTTAKQASCAPNPKPAAS
jgi:hypothetical protein